MLHNANVACSLVFLSALACGCAVIRDTPARCYNVEDGKIVAMTFTDLSYDHGRVFGTMPDGEKLHGEYMLGNHDRYRSEPGWLKPGSAAAEGTTDWASEYGYGQKSNAIPVGTATLTGEHGTVLEIVLYTINKAISVGDGIGRDNDGHRYRVYIGDIEDTTVDPGKPR